MLFLSGATSREVLLLARTVFAILHILRTNISRTDLIRFRAPFARLDVVLRKTRAASIVSSLFRGAAHWFRLLGDSDRAGPARVPAFLAERGLISASRGASASSCHRCASSVGEEVVGAFFFYFEAVRTESTRRAGFAGRCASADEVVTACSRRARRVDL